MRSNSESRNGTTVVDCDVHVSYRSLEDDLPNYMPASSPYIEHIKRTSSYLGHLWPISRHDRSSSSGAGKLTHLRNTVTSPDDLSDLWNDFNVDYAIVNSLAKTNEIPEVGKRAQLMRANNDQLIDTFLDERSNLLGLCSITPSRPAMAAEEIDRLGNEDQIVGALMVTNGTHLPLGDPKYDQIYEAIEDNDLTVAYHAVTGPATGIEFPVIGWNVQKYLSHHALAHPYYLMLTLTSLLTNGVPEKFPDLNFVFLEAGLTWIPYIFRLNREYGQRQYDAPLLEKHPEEYVRERCYFGTQPVDEPIDHQHLKYLIEIAGVDSLLFSTDYPHFDFDNPDTLTRHINRLFSEEEQEKLFYRNAKEAFNLNV